MHKKIGDRMWINTRFGQEIVTISNIYEFPEGGIAYGFYSRKAGRNLLEQCECPKCLPGVIERKKNNKHYIGDPKRHVLIDVG
jgi:hypothetical protein